jgi:polyhydroxybutyrate depolymerase
MEMLMKVRQLLPLAALLASCSPATTSPSLADTGSLTSDAGSTTQDTGSSSADANSPASDVGVPITDTGSNAPGDRPLVRRVTDHTIDQVVNGENLERSFHIMAPSRIDENINYPVLFAFHGRGGRGRNFVSSLIPFAEAGRFVAILPNGIDRGWNLGADPTQPDDLAFVDSIIDYLLQFRGLNLGRMYALGFSNGAGLVHQLAANRSHFTAHAAMATALIEGNEPSAEVHRASFLTLHGVDDPVCPYEGGPGRVRANFIAAEASAQIWADQLGCPRSPSEAGDTEAGNRRFVWAPCDEGHRVVHYGVVGSEHNIPRTTEDGLYDLIVGFFEATP